MKGNKFINWKRIKKEDVYVKHTVPVEEGLMDLLYEIRNSLIDNFLIRLSQFARVENVTFHLPNLRNI